jgi:hypothetical protein
VHNYKRMVWLGINYFHQYVLVSTEEEQLVALLRDLNIE